MKSPNPPYWVIVLGTTILSLVTLLALYRSWSEKMMSEWAVAAVTGSVVFSIGEAVRRRLEK